MPSPTVYIRSSGLSKEDDCGSGSLTASDQFTINQIVPLSNNEARKMASDKKEAGRLEGDELIRDIAGPNTS